MIGQGAKALLATALMALLVTGCGGGGSSSSPAVPAAATPPTPTAALSTDSYKLGSGDRLRVTVFQHPDLSGEFALDGAGNFAMPLVGEVQAYGLTTREVEQRVQGQFSNGFLVDPKVSIEVLNYRPFYILGEVKAPGAYQFVNGMTVLNAVALSGGFSYRAKQSDFLLQRGGSNTAGAPVSGETPLLPGDIVTVQERFF